MKTQLLAALALCLLASACGAADVNQAGDEKNLVDKIIDIADLAISRDGQKREDLKLEMVKRYSAPKNELLSGSPSSDYQRDLLKKLEGRQYWCVYYTSKSAEEGGDTGIFIDAKTFEVIGIYRGR